MAHFVTLDLAQNTLSDPRSSRGEGDEAICLRFLTAFGMTLPVRLLPPEDFIGGRNDNGNPVAYLREFAS